MAAATQAIPQTDAPQDQPIGKYRWVICALLFFATTINYIDRQVIGILKPTMAHELGWTEVDYGDIIFAFSFAYAIGLVVVGRIIDKLGTKRGFSLAIIFWSVAAMGHSFARSVFGFQVARFSLGLGESGNFPASIKTVAEWFPKKERALATGIFNAGSNVGAVLAPIAVPWITLTYGWREAFVATGAIGFLWLIFWWILFKRPQEHPKLSKRELEYIQTDPPDAAQSVPWRSLLRHRQTWAFALGKFLTDPVWWLYLYWVPDFLNKSHGVTLLNVGLPLVAIYLIADFGSIGGGWLSSSFIKRGWKVSRSRKTAMLICAVAVTPIVFASQVQSEWAAVLLVGLAAAAHQGWSANIFTTASDMFPRNAVGSVVGIGGMAGAIGGMVVAKAVGYILQATGSYFLIFLIAGSMYLLALGLMHLICPNLDPVELRESTT